MPPNEGKPIAVVERMKFDDLAWDRSDDIAKAWKDVLSDEKILREIGRFIIKHEDRQKNFSIYRKDRST